MLRHTSEKERWNLSSKLAQSEEQVRHLTDRVAVLTRRSESGAGTQVDDRVQGQWHCFKKTIVKGYNRILKSLKSFYNGLE